MKPWPPKDPNAALKPYWFDWREWLTNEDDGTLELYDVAVEGIQSGDTSPLTIASHTNDAGLILVRLSGGTIGRVYIVRCRITLSTGHVEDMSRTVCIEEQ